MDKTAKKLHDNQSYYYSIYNIYILMSPEEGKVTNGTSAVCFTGKGQ